MPDVDPERTDPYGRLAAARIGGGQFASLMALSGMPVAERYNPAGMVGWKSMWTHSLLDAMRSALGTGPAWGGSGLKFVHHARALGKSDPDLEDDGSVCEG